MKLEKSYNTKQYFHSFYRQNHALLVLSFLFTVICFPANLIGSWLLGQVIDAITEVSMNRLRTIILVSIIFIVTMFFFTILLYWVKSNFIRKALIQYKNLAFEKISEKNIAAFSRENTGSYISMLTNDAASIEENYLRIQLFRIRIRRSSDMDLSGNRTATNLFRGHCRTQLVM